MVDVDIYYVDALGWPWLVAKVKAVLRQTENGKGGTASGERKHK